MAIHLRSISVIFRKLYDHSDWRKSADCTEKLLITFECIRMINVKSEKKKSRKEKVKQSLESSDGCKCGFSFYIQIISNKTECSTSQQKNRMEKWKRMRKLIYHDINARTYTKKKKKNVYQMREKFVSNGDGGGGHHRINFMAIKIKTDFIINWITLTAACVSDGVFIRCLLLFFWWIKLICAYIWYC